MLEPREGALWCPAGGFAVDPRQPSELAVVTHAHADHARPGSARYLCAEASVALLRARLGAEARVEGLAWGERRALGEVELSLHPAGHMLGAAQVRIEGEQGVALITGDFKLGGDPTCEPCEELPCDLLVSEATFALPVFRWPEPARVLDELLAWRAENRAAGVTSLVAAYALGKGPRLLAELARRGEREPVFVHGALLEPAALYRAAGLDLAPTRALSEAAPEELRGALVLAPPRALGTTWARCFPERALASASGWARLRGRRRRGGLARGFVLSDHADWAGLLRKVESSGARRVVTLAGYGAELARYLREERGLAAEHWALSA